MNIHNASIYNLKDLIAKKRISPEELSNLTITKINKENKKINAFITVMDKPQIDSSKKDQPLFGIPFSMKDTYNVRGVRTTAGSKVLDNYISSYDATVYSKLKDAGAVLIGKTNCDGWGHGSSTENSDYGPTKNPWNFEHVPGGSSGGSAAAVASDLGTFSIGEDTGGSIRQPASFCGVVGLKVTYGLVSRYGCIAYASSLDTVGPIARSVEDCALILDVIAGFDPYDGTSFATGQQSYTKNLSKSIKGLTIGIPKEYFVDGVDSEVIQAIDAAKKVFVTMGAKIKEVSLPMTKYAISTYYLVATSETSSNLARYDSIRFGNSRDTFNDESRRRIMLGAFTLSAGYYDAYYKKAAKVRTLIKRDFDDAFKKVDVLLAPTAPTPPFKIGENTANPLQMYLQDAFTVPVSMAGIPALAIPAGLTKNNLPIGMQLIGRALDESRLLNIGYQFEKQIGGFKTL